MPAELLLLLIVAFANPSCQVLSSLRMGEAPAPCSSETLPSGPSRELRHISTTVLWPQLLFLWTQESRYSAVQPEIRESRLLHTYTSLYSRDHRSKTPQLPFLRPQEPGPSQLLSPLSCNPGRPDRVWPW